MASENMYRSTKNARSSLLNESTSKIKVFPLQQSKTLSLSRSEIPNLKILNGDHVIKGRKVQFSIVEKREYPIILGDHPDCQCGPPLSISWEYIDATKMNIDDYETKNPHRRRENDLKLSFDERRKIISKNCCYREEELKNILKDIKRIRKERNDSRKELNNSKLEKMIEFARKKLRICKS